MQRQTNISIEQKSRGTEAYVQTGLDKRAELFSGKWLLFPKHHAVAIRVNMHGRVLVEDMQSPGFEPQHYKTKN